MQRAARTPRALRATTRPSATPAAPAPASHAPSGADDRSARALEIAALDWQPLREHVAACRACRLCEGRTQTVFGVGNERAHWMIVGEAPGEQEDLQGEPFVGTVGQLLDSMLRAIGLTRGAAEPAQQVYIANTLKCRPPGNRNPEPDELAQCEPLPAPADRAGAAAHHPRDGALRGADACCAAASRSAGCAAACTATTACR